MNELIQNMGNLFDISAYLTEYSSEKICYRIPESLGKIQIDEAKLMDEYYDVRSVNIGIWSNGDQDITIYLKQKSVSPCGRYIQYE